MNKVELAQQVSQTSRWEWLPGMLVTDGVALAYRVVHDGTLTLVANCRSWPSQDLDLMMSSEEPYYPVMEDAATLGCVLELVRRVWGEEAWVQYEDNKWNCWVMKDGCLFPFTGLTQGESLLLALQGA